MGFYPVPKHTRTAVSAQLNRQQFYYIDIGDLGNHIIGSILDVASVVLQSKFSLVHIAAPQKQFSLGLLRYVPHSIFTIDVELAFTFVINGDVNRNDVPKIVRTPPFVHNLRRHIRLWEAQWVKSESSTGTRFITLLYRRRDLNGTGVNNAITVPLLRHLYEVIGVVTDNLLRYKPRYHREQDKADNFDPYFRGFDIDDLRVMGASNLNTMMRTKPFWSWPLSPQIWQEHPNLIPTQFFSQYSVYYYLKHVHGKAKTAFLANKSAMRRLVGSKFGLTGQNTGMTKILFDSVRARKPDYIHDDSYNTITQNKSSAHSLGHFDEMSDSALVQEVNKRLWST